MIHNTTVAIVFAKVLRISFVFIVKNWWHISICVGDLLLQENGNGNKLPRRWTYQGEHEIQSANKATNRYESHYISRDFIMCVAMIMCIMGYNTFAVLYCMDYIVKYRNFFRYLSLLLYRCVFHYSDSYYFAHCKNNGVSIVGVCVLKDKNVACNCEICYDSYIVSYITYDAAYFLGKTSCSFNNIILNVSVFAPRLRSI